MKKRLLVVLVCLMTCILLFQTLPHGIQATTNPTAKGMTEFALQAYANHWGYIYGTFGYVATETLIKGKISQYPSVFAVIMSDGRTAAEHAREWLGSRVVDCAGLIKAYLWWKSDGSGPAYNSTQDYSANSLYRNATVKGPISTIPNTHGLLVWRDGHMGVYIGNGEVIEARGVEYGVVKTRLSDRNWTNWFRSPYLTYPTTGWQTIDNQQYYYQNGVYLTGPQVVDGKHVLLGPDGARLIGFQVVDGKVVYYSPDGTSVSGWQTVDGSRYYFDPSGSPLTGWQTLDGKTVLFDTNGVMLTGWQELDGSLYYLDNSGAAMTGLLTVDGCSLEFDLSGRLMTGWQGEGAARTWRNLTGQVVTGLQMVGDGIYLFDTQGRIMTGLQSVDGKSMYFDPATGKRLDSGAVMINDQPVLSLADGTLATEGQWLLTGPESFLAGPSGRLAIGLTPVKVFAADGSEHALTLALDPKTGALLPTNQTDWQIGPKSPVLTAPDEVSASGLQLTVAGTPASESQWFVLDPTVASVDAAGQVKAVSSGQTLAFLADADGFYASMRITVLPQASSLELTSPTVTLEPGMAAVPPIDGLSPAVRSQLKLVSSDPECVAILPDGRQLAQAPGTAEITLTGAGSESLTWTVNVRRPAVGISAARSSLTLAVGGEFADLFKVVPAAAARTDFTVASSNSAIAKVSAQKVVQGVAAGTAVITARLDALTAACTVTVGGQLTTLKNGSAGDRVRQMQVILSGLGYLCGSIDGLFGGQTEFAVASLQSNMQLEPTGQADPALQMLLTQGQAKPAAPLVSAGMLQMGDTGEQVRVLETRLKSLSYLKAVPDDQYDAVTARAVTTLQALNGLALTGTAGPSEISLLYRPGVIASDPVLALNDSGYEVRQLQERLAELSFYAGPIDGLYSLSFESMVKTFQLQAGLEVDGKAGYYTQSTVYAASAPVKTGTDPVTTPATTVAPTATPEPTAAPTAVPTAVPEPTATPAPTATPTPTPEPTTAPVAQPVVLQDGSVGPEVVSLEVRLIELGYHLDLADDRYTSLTATSVKAFQKRAGLGITGIADLTSQNRLAAGTAPRTATSYRRGSYGDGVKRVQQRLIALGLLGGQADGRFGPMTETAARAFQKKFGLSVDGVIGPRSLARLYYSETGAPPISVGTGGSTPTVTEPAPQTNEGTLTAPTLTTSLRRGSRGSVVKQVQTRLIQLGYLPAGSADGSFGPVTEKAVLAYQRKAGLKVDGIVGRMTIASLYSLSAPHA